MKGEREIVQWTVSIWQDEQVLEMDSHSNGHTGTVHLKMVKMVYFMLHVFTKHKKTPRAVCVVGEGEGAPRPGGAQQKGRQRGARMPEGPARPGRALLPGGGLGRVERVQQGCAADPRPCHGVLCPVPGQGRRPGARPPASERHKSALSAGAAPAGGR